MQTINQIKKEIKEHKKKAGIFTKEEMARRIIAIREFSWCMKDIELKALLTQTQDVLKLIDERIELINFTKDSLIKSASDYPIVFMGLCERIKELESLKSKLIGDAEK
jgi:predicted metal-dependent peptidase